MRVALVHDYLKEAGGAERVLRALSEMYPEAPIYTAFVDKRSRAARMFADRQVIESKWGWWLKLPRFHSYFRFFLPLVWKSIDLSDYDLVLTSCSGYIARGFRVGEKTRVVAYCHTPPKWLYGYETPTRASAKWWGKVYLTVWGPLVRYFDYQSAQRVDKWIANSQEVKRRIAKFYRKQAVVVYPPIEVEQSRNHAITQSRDNYYLVVARQVGAKGIELAIAACSKLGRRLVVVGEGPKTKDKRQKTKVVECTGWVGERELARLYGGARGYLALAVDEDLGMTALEAIASGTPVVALASGGYKETVIPANQRISESANQREQMATGVLVEDFTVAGVVEGMRRLEKTEWDREGMKKWAKKLGRARFEREVRGIIDS